GEGTATAVLRAATGLDETDARTALAAFGLIAEQVERPASTLSPGERTRAELALGAPRAAGRAVRRPPRRALRRGAPPRPGGRATDSRALGSRKMATAAPAPRTR